MKWPVILTLCISSCSSRSSILDGSNGFMLQFFQPGDTLVGIDNDKEIIASFKEVLEGKSHNTTCEPTGMITFFNNGSIVYEGYFSTQATGAADGCAYMVSGQKGQKLTYKAGMFLDEEFYRLKKNNEPGNQD